VEKKKKRTKKRRVGDDVVDETRVVM